MKNLFLRRVIKNLAQNEQETQQPGINLAVYNFPFGDSLGKYKTFQDIRGQFYTVPYI